MFDESDFRGKTTVKKRMRTAGTVRDAGTKKTGGKNGAERQEKSGRAERVPKRTEPESRKDDFDEETDAEAAAICLNCSRRHCFLDDNLPCRRYHREMRRLLARRQSECAKSQR